MEGTAETAQTSTATEPGVVGNDAMPTEILPPSEHATKVTEEGPHYSNTDTNETNNNNMNTTTNEENISTIPIPEEELLETPHHLITSLTLQLAQKEDEITRLSQLLFTQRVEQQTTINDILSHSKNSVLIPEWQQQLIQENLLLKSKIADFKSLLNNPKGVLSEGWSYKLSQQTHTITALESRLNLLETDLVMTKMHLAETTELCEVFRVRYERSMKAFALLQQLISQQYAELVVYYKEQERERFMAFLKGQGQEEWMRANGVLIEGGKVENNDVEEVTKDGNPGVESDVYEDNMVSQNALFLIANGEQNPTETRAEELVMESIDGEKQDIVEAKTEEVAKVDNNEQPQVIANSPSIKTKTTLTVDTTSQQQQQHHQQEADFNVPPLSPSTVNFFENISKCTYRLNEILNAAILETNINNVNLNPSPPTMPTDNFSTYGNRSNSIPTLPKRASIKNGLKKLFGFTGDNQSSSSPSTSTSQESFTVDNEQQQYQQLQPQQPNNSHWRSFSHPASAASGNDSVNNNIVRSVSSGQGKENATNNWAGRLQSVFWGNSGQPNNSATSTTGN